MEVNSGRFVIKQEIKEEDEVSFELIDGQSYSLEPVKEESVLNKVEQVEHRLDLIDNKSRFVADEIKAENEMKQEDLYDTKLNESIEFKKHKNCEWSKPLINAPDPLALPEMQGVSVMEELVIKREIKKEDDQSCSLETVKKESVLNEIRQVEHCQDLINSQSHFVGGGIKKENEIKQEDLDDSESNEDIEFEEEEINCEWFAPLVDEPDPLALPEMSDTSESFNSNASESSSSSTTNDSSRITENNTGDKIYKGDSSSSQSNSIEKNLLKCSLCDYSCNKSSQLKTHIIIHSKKKPFKCTECIFSSDRVQALKTHMMTHTGEKPFKCKECDHCFSRPHCLKIHIMRHTGQKPLKCKECDYSCIAQSNLKRHMMTHTGKKPFKCKECDNCYTQSAHLKRHMMTHTGEKPFKCKECDFSFSRSSHLKRHMMTHIEKKPLKCQKCDYSCIRPQSLKNHMLKHTRKKTFKRKK